MKEKEQMSIAIVGLLLGAVVIYFLTKPRGIYGITTPSSTTTGGQLPAGALGVVEIKGVGKFYPKSREELYELLKLKAIYEGISQLPIFGSKTSIGQPSDIKERLRRNIRR